MYNYNQTKPKKTRNHCWSWAFDGRSSRLFSKPKYAVLQQQWI